MQYKQRLEEAEARYNELTASMADSAVINDPEQYRKVAKMQSELTDLVATYRQWNKADQELGDARAMLDDSDPDLREMAVAEVERLETLTTRLEDELRIQLLPKDPNDEKNIVLEIRKGAGGDEASL